MLASIDRSVQHQAVKRVDMAAYSFEEGPSERRKLGNVGEDDAFALARSRANLLFSMQAAIAIAPTIFSPYTDGNIHFTIAGLRVHDGTCATCRFKFYFPNGRTSGKKK